MHQRHTHRFSADGPPGPWEPGSGSIDWPARLADLRASGYDGPIGLEYYPTIESAESVAYIKKIAATA